MTTKSTTDELSNEFSDEQLERAAAELFGFTEQELRSGGMAQNDIRVEQVRRTAARIELAGVLPMLTEWRESDRGGNHPGGRPPHINDRALLIAVMLLRAEGTPILITHLRDLFAYRFSKPSLAELHVRSDGHSTDPHVMGDRWYHRARRALLRVVEPMDSWPGPRTLTIRTERESIVALRDQDTALLRQERATRFSTALLGMPSSALLSDHEHVYKTAPLTVDQTNLPAFSAHGIRKRDAKSGREMAKIRTDGTEIQRHVLELDAGWMPREFSSVSRDKAAISGQQSQLEWVYALTAIASVPGPELPNLILGASMNTPNTQIAEETLRPVRELVARGFHPHHLTGDRGYVQLSAYAYQKPLAALGRVAKP